jgi:hypothetical protein
MPGLLQEVTALAEAALKPVVAGAGIAGGVSRK